jgi:glycosyltransferase involved in cell wall biosynthesis
MGILFAGIVISFIVILIINIIFFSINIVFWAFNGLQSILLEMNFVERIHASILFKWILFLDFAWFVMSIGYFLKRKHFKTNSDLYYLKENLITNPKIFVIIPSFNEEDAIEKVVNDFKHQKYVNNILVVDNNSSDKTVELAKKSGAQVIKKSMNKGYAHSCVMGFQEALKTNDDLIVLAESDDTFSAFDIEKMIPYLSNCDMVVGTRQVQALTEKGNQLGMYHVWGNLILAKLIQLKYFSLLHMGVVQLTDVGCSYRCIRKNSLKKIINKFTQNESNEIVTDAQGGLFALFMTILAIENDLKIIEIPISFKKRIGFSKTQSEKKFRGTIYGIKFLWYILRK